MRTCWMVLVVAAACQPFPAAKDTTPKIDIAATALGTLDRDTAAMLELIGTLFGEVKVSVATNVTLDLKPHTSTTASYDDTEIRITLPSPANSPDEAGAYWKAQGALTGGWDGGGFADDIDQARLARFASFTTLARQIGQFLVYAYVGPIEVGPRELLADRLAAALLDRMAVRPELAELFTKYRALLARWQAAIPDGVRVELPANDRELDAWVASHPIPEEPAAAAALAVARQVRVLSKPPKLGPLVAEALLAPYQNRVAKIDYALAKLVVTSSRDVPAGFTTLQRPAGNVRELVTSLLDTDGKFHTLACATGGCEYTSEGGASSKLAIANVLGGELAEYARVLDVAIVGDKIWLLLGGDNQRAALALLDVSRPDALRPTATWQPVAAGRIAASPSGAVSVLLLRAGGWAIERFEAAARAETTTPNKAAAWSFKVANGGDADGKNGAAGGALGDCTANDAGTIYCTAGVRIRVLDKDKISTLAGSTRDWVDAVDPKKVAFTSPVRLRATRDGLLLVDRKYAEDGKAIWKVRQIELKK